MYKNVLDTVRYMSSLQSCMQNRPLRNLDTMPIHSIEGLMPAHIPRKVSIVVFISAAISLCTPVVGWM